MRIRFLAIGLIAGLLAACTGSKTDPKPRSTAVSRPPSQSVSSSSPSPTQTGPLTTGPNVRPGEKPPAYPSLARQHTEVGAIAFGGYYFRALDWSIATNDDYLLRRIALAECGACSRAHAALTALKSKGEREVGGRIAILAASVDRTRYRISYDVAVKVSYREDEVRIAESDGSMRTTSPAVRSASSVVLIAWRGARWRVVDVTKVAA